MSNLTAGIQLPALSIDIVVDSRGLNNEMRNVTETAINNAENLGGKLSAIGDKMTKCLTVPIMGVAVAMGKFAMDTETSLSTISGRLGTTTKETEELKEVAQGLYRNGFGESLDDCVNDLVILQQNIKETSNLTKEQKQDLLEQMNTIKKLFGAESEEITRTLNNMLRNGLINNVQDGLDIITRGFQEGLNSGGDLLDVLYEYSPQFKKLGLQGSESLAYIKAGLDAGAYNADKMADALKELSIRAIDGSDTTIEGFTLMGLNAEEMMNKFAQGGDVAQEALKQTIEGLKNIEDPLKQDLAGVDLFGTMWEDSSKQAILAMGDVTGGLDNITNATKKAGEEVNNTSAVKLTSALRDLKTELIPLAADVIPSVVEVVKDITSWFTNLSDGTKKTIVKLGALAAAFGPVLSVGGRLISSGAGIVRAITGIGTASSVATGASTLAGGSGLLGMVGGMGSLLSTTGPFIAGVVAVGGAIHAMSEKNEYMNTSLSTTKEELPFLQKAFNYFNGEVIKSRKEMEKLGLVYKEWDKNVSKDLQVSLETTGEKFANLNFEVQRLANNNIVISEDTKNNLINQTTQICNGIIEEIKSHSEESQAALREVFGADGKKDWYEDTVLSNMGGSWAQAITEIQGKEAEITAIYEKAYNEHREIAASEKVAIEELYADIAEIKLNALATSDDELLAAQADFNVRCRQLDEKGISDLLQEKAKARDKQIEEDTLFYDTQIEMLTMNLNNMNETDRIAAEQAIRDLEKQRDEKIQTHRDTYKGYLDTIEKEYPNIYDRINYHNGKILDVEQMKDRNLWQTSTEMYEGLNNITETGMQKVYNKQKKAYEDLYVVVDETTGRVTGIWDKQGDTIIGTTDKITGELTNMRNSYYENIDEMVISMREAIDSNKNMDKETRKAAESIVNSLTDIKDNGDGTYSAIARLNDTPVQVKVDSDGTIRNINEIVNAMNSIPPEIFTVVNVSSIGLSSALELGIGVNGNHYNGLDYVPYDGYTARLHEGERVLTKKENENYTSNKTDLTINFNRSVDNPSETARKLKNTLVDLGFAM